MIFGMAPAKEPREALFIDGGGGAIHTDPPTGQVIGANHPRIHGGLDLMPERIVAQVAQYFAETIIGEICVAYGLAQQSPQCFGACVRPILDMAHKVVAFRQNMRQPGHRDTAKTETLPVAVPGHWLVENLVQLQSLAEHM